MAGKITKRERIEVPEASPLASESSATVDMRESCRAFGSNAVLAAIDALRQHGGMVPDDRITTLMRQAGGEKCKAESFPIVVSWVESAKRALVPALQQLDKENDRLVAEVNSLHERLAAMQAEHATHCANMKATYDNHVADLQRRLDKKNNALRVASAQADAALAEH